MSNNDDNTKQKLTTEEYMVAFIDVLGASKKIKTDSIGSLNTVHRVYERALKLYNEQPLFERHTTFGEDDTVEQIKIKIFSDNIVLYTKVNDDLRGCFIHLVYLAAFMQAIFLNEGLLVRGGIAKGDFYGDDIMIWGNALVTAYEIENNIAVYPRIVVQSGIINGVEEEFAKEFECLSVDEDGCYYVDYLSDYLFDDIDGAINKAVDKCEIELKDAGYKSEKENSKVIQKLIWQKNYIERCKNRAQKR